jgi:hypothetical protein
MALAVAVPRKWPSTSSSRGIRLTADERLLIRSLEEELGVEVTQLLRLGLRALVSLGMPLAERSLLSLVTADSTITMRPNHKDLLIMASLRKELGKGATNNAICRIALHALARKEQLARAAMSAARLAAAEPPTTAAPDHVSLELKCCESCGGNFLRPIGSDVKHCAKRHSAPVSLLDRQRLAAALVEGEEGRKAARR